MIYDTKSGDIHQITDDWYDASSPVFGSDGKYLFFTSSRDFNPVYSWTEWNHAYQDMSKVYFVTLQNSTASPFEPKNDEVEVVVEENETTDNGKEKKSKKSKENKKEESVKPINIDFDGIQSRVIGIPGKAGSYWNLSPVGSKLYYVYSSSKANGPQLKLYDLKDRS